MFSLLPPNSPKLAEDVEKIKRMVAHKNSILNQEDISSAFIRETNSDLQYYADDTNTFKVISEDAHVASLGVIDDNFNEENSMATKFEEAPLESKYQDSVHLSVPIEYEFQVSATDSEYKGSACLLTPVESECEVFVAESEIPYSVQSPVPIESASQFQDTVQSSECQDLSPESDYLDAVHLSVPIISECYEFTAESESQDSVQSSVPIESECHESTAESEYQDSVHSSVPIKSEYHRSVTESEHHDSEVSAVSGDAACCWKSVHQEVRDIIEFFPQDLMKQVKCEDALLNVVTILCIQFEKKLAKMRGEMELAATHHGNELSSVKHKLELSLAKHDIEVAAAKHEIALCNAKHEMEIAAMRRKMEIAAAKHERELAVAKHDIYQLSSSANEEVRLCKALRH